MIYIQKKNGSKMTLGFVFACTFGKIYVERKNPIFNERSAKNEEVK